MVSIVKVSMPSFLQLSEKVEKCVSFCTSTKIYAKKSVHPSNLRFDLSRCQGIKLIWVGVIFQNNFKMCDSYRLCNILFWIFATDHIIDVLSTCCKWVVGSGQVNTALWLHMVTLVFLRGLCRYVWVNILVLSPLRGAPQSVHAATIMMCFIC